MNNQNMIIEKAFFNPSHSGIIVKELKSNSEIISDSDTEIDNIISWNKQIIIKPYAKYSWLFPLYFESPESIDLNSISTLGNGLITWRLMNGNTENLISNIVPIPASSKKYPFSILVHHPTKIVIKNAFNVTIKLTSMDKNLLQPRLDLDLKKSTGLFVSTFSPQIGPKLNFGESFSFSLTIIALESGIQTLKGIRIIDSQKHIIYKLKELITVHVEIE